MAALKNSRHEKFAQNVFAGQTQRQAYMDAFPNSTSWKIETVDRKASELAHRPDVKKRVEELKNKAADKLIMSLLERKIRLSEIARSDIELSKQQMQAIEILNKMDGVYVNKAEVQLAAPVSDTAKKVAAILDE